MPRYFFDVHDKEGTFRDDVGIDLPDMDAAIAEARRALADMTKELMADPTAKDMHIVIHDHSDGPVQLTVTMQTTWLDGRFHKDGGPLKKDGAD
jgi:hypothetical protein